MKPVTIFRACEWSFKSHGSHIMFVEFQGSCRFVFLKAACISKEATVKCFVLGKAKALDSPPCKVCIYHLLPIIFCCIYCEYQLSKARRSLGDKLRCCHGQIFSVPIISSLAISCAWLSMTSKADKLPLETEPVVWDNESS